MRGLRSAIALLVILVGLGAYIYFVAWEDDGTRDRPEQRQGFHDRFRAELQSWQLPTLALRGSLEHRLDQAVGAIDTLVGSGAQSL